MKISKCKKELARIISEHGGWRNGAESESEFAAQDGDGTGSIDFFKSTPRYDKNDKYWKGEYDVCERISQSGFTIKNFHQTILSRAEYFHLYQAQDADGWIECNGGEFPVGEGDRIDVKFSDGDEFFDVGSDWDWGEDVDGCNIIAYRLHKHEKYKPEFCESVMRSIPEPTAKPSIEQLAADYRKAKDFAERKQREADDAKDGADARLKALEIAAEDLGFNIEPITTKQDWL